jgi:hypothetical protein
MIATARRIDPVGVTEGQRILICKSAPEGLMDQAWMWGGRTARFDSVGTLAEALALCLHEPVDKLIVNLFSFTSSDLTALKFFREMRPSQHVVIVSTEEITPMLLESDLADECHTVRMPERLRTRAHRTRPSEPPQ